MIDGVVNLGHLERLSAEIVLGGEAALLTHIYSEAPAYEWIAAPGEGIAALDDIARAALVYLDFWRDTGDRRARDRARAALIVVLHLQAESGAFHNFILDYAGTPNRGGVTSLGLFDWWTCRAFWALARGYAAFRAIDRPFAARLREAYRTTERLLARRIGTVGQFTVLHGIRFPAWLPSDSSALAALALLGLTEYQATAPNERTARLLTALAEGIAACQLGGPGDFPWGLHPHSLLAPLPWHAWGAHEAQALAGAGQLLGRPAWVAAAAREVDGFFAWQLLGGQLHALDPLPGIWGQQAYGINCQVQAALAVYRATGEPRYARQAGLHASWFTGNNAAGRPLYDPHTGRGYDGIDRRGEVSAHAGAESTIESLLALSAVVAVPEAVRYLHHRAGEGTTWRSFPLRAERYQPAGAALPGDWTVSTDGIRWACAFAVDRPGTYRLYLGRDGADVAAGAGSARLALDDRVPWTLPPPAPGRTCPWLDLVTAEPIVLEGGAHRWTLELRGEQSARRPHLAGLLLQPLTMRRTFVGPADDSLTATLDLDAGLLSWSRE